MQRSIVIIYSRPGCHLCEEAKATILAAGCLDEFELREVNIEGDPGALAQYQYDIPVVFINGVRVFKHKVDPKEFRRKLRRLAGQ